MKKIFLVLGTNVTLLFTATAKGDFKTVQKSVEGKITLKNIKQDNTTPGTEQFVRNLDVTYKVTGNGNTTTGQGYTLTAVKGDTTLPAANRKYMLIKVTTTDWNTAILTAQLCDKEGTPLSGTGTAAFNNEKPGTSGHLFVEELKKNNQLNGTVSVTADDLHQAYLGSGTINEAILTTNGEKFNVTLTDVTHENGYAAKVGNQKLEFSAGDEIMSFTAKYNDNKVGDVGQQQPAM